MSKTYKNGLFKKKNLYKTDFFLKIHTSGNTALFVCLSFVQTKIVSTNIPFEFCQKTASGETGTKLMRQKIDSLKRRITVYTLFVFRLLFVGSSMFRRYLRIVYSRLESDYEISEDDRHMGVAYSVSVANLESGYGN